MSALFNKALRQSDSLRTDLAALQTALDAGTPSPALQGQIAISITAFSATLDTYAKHISAELVADNKARDSERLADFRARLAEHKTHFANLQAEADELRQRANRAELLGTGASHRRPHAHTPENPYSNAAVAQRGLDTGNGLFAGAKPQGIPGYGLGSGDEARETYGLHEQSALARGNAALDEFLERGRAVLGDLGQQREMLKGTQKKLYSVANTLGISGDTIRMVERRAKQDKWIFWAGVVIFVIFVWLVLKYLR